MLRTAALLSVLLPTAAFGAVQTETITYESGDQTLEGFLAYDDAAEGPQPGVLIVHEWWGLTEHPKNSARKLAELGYVAFALDMYGKDNVTEDPQQASQWSGQFKQDTQLARERFTAALDLLREREEVNGDKIAAMGYCFGGTIVLEMARMGLDLDGVVSFHGGLSSNVPEDERDIQASILVCHGAADTHVPAEELQAFKDEMAEAEADWMLISYGGAVHSFTNPNADMPTAHYDPKAAERSWDHMRLFLDEVLKGGE